MSNHHPNWSKLGDMGVQMETSLRGEFVRLRGLDRETAICIGYMLTRRLDEICGGSMYTTATYTLEQALRDADAREHAGDLAFGETRPANRNCAVRVKCESLVDSDGNLNPGGNSSYTLIADVRNDFEDDPTPAGRMKLQQGFNETIEALEL